ncbi:hypothetical protein [Saccharothrix lopnurensis]|uniref:Uncharacterized protein n=1 Tax=Saccharothrix lopnurensis TaxID=1670621 RepID=A0ABW1PH68_9PSEU
MVIGFAIALVGNTATNTASVDEPWWPFAVWGAVAALIAVARRQWQDEVARRSLNDPYPLPVRRRAAPADLAGDDLLATWRRVPTGRLVVLGAPDAGKTVPPVRFVVGLDVRRRLAATSAPPGTAGAPAATPPGSARPSPHPTR